MSSHAPARPARKSALPLLLSLAAPLALTGLFYLLRGNSAAMNGWVFGVARPLEQWLGRLWSHLPFSVAEGLVTVFLLGCAAFLVWAAVSALRRRSVRVLGRRLAALAAALLWVWTGCCWLWSAGYYADSFSQRSGLEPVPHSVAELAQMTDYFARQAAALSVCVSRDDGGHFAEELDGCFARGVNVYDSLAAEFPCLAARAVACKPMVYSRLQSMLGFTGGYFPFTGEANVNVDAPACLVPATIAHEMSHQRMVVSELEANFVGIAAAVTCDDPVFQYSGYLMGLIQLCNALYPVAPEQWNQIAAATFTPELTTDWQDNSAYWAALDSPAQETAQQTFDSFLKGNGQELGIRSYGACVDLLVTYFGPVAGLAGESGLSFPPVLW